MDSTRTAIGRLKMGIRCNSHANDRPVFDLLKIGLKVWLPDQHKR